jgi:crotonobetainyl-CoA:carnitine CoA-transferase CaiB-like acyl-CoA transferase
MPPSDAPSSPGALAGIRVLDITSGVAGPWCTKLLASYGADVIKVEPPGVGDRSRGHGPFPGGVPHREMSALFLWLNTGKRSVTLDVATPTGRDLLLRIAARCDAVVLDRPTPELRALRLAPDDFAGVAPDAVVTTVSAFGATGPRAGWAATNLVSYAAGGQHYLTGDADREPLQNGGYQAGYQAGAHAFGATLCALWDARERGRAQHVDVAGMEAQASILEMYLPDHAYRRSDALSKRRGNFASAAVGIYPAADGHIGIHVMPKNWHQLTDAMGAPHVADDERFADNRARLRHDDELSAEIYAWAATLTRQQAYERAGATRAPISPVNTVADLLASPHLRARNFFATVEHPVTGTYDYPGAPARMSRTPASQRRAPLLGEHNREVLVDLAGLAPRDVRALRAAGIV